MTDLHSPYLLLVALFSLYSPLAAATSYLPIVSALSRSDQRKLAIGLFVCASVFSMSTLWIGEPLLELLGLSTASLIVTGGIVLMFDSIRIVRGGLELQVPERIPAPVSWKSVLFIPVTFPLTLNVPTFAFFVSYRAEASSLREVAALSVAAIIHASITAITLYASGYVEKRVSLKGRIFLARVAGILVTATAVSLLASGISRMVVDSLNAYSR